MATAKKLPSGHWRVQVYLGRAPDGKKIYRSITAFTKREAEAAAAELALHRESASHTDITVLQALSVYLDSRRGVLSPTTEAEYERTICRSYTSIENIKLSKLTPALVQAWISEGARKKSLKTIKNEFVLLRSALERSGITLRSSDYYFPQKKNIERYIPGDKDIQKVLSVALGDYRVAALLAAFGPMRRSEICALTLNDIEGNCIRVNKAIVKDKNKKWVLKEPKTYSSNRLIPLPQFVIDEFKLNGKIKISPDAITHQHAHILRKAEVPYFRFHDYRHYGASILHALGMPDKYIMQRGGWSNDGTLKNIYQHTLDSIAREQNDLANQHFEKISHEISHKK